MKDLNINTRLEIIFVLSRDKTINAVKKKIGLYEPTLMVDFLEKFMLYHDFSKKFHDMVILQNHEIFCIDLFPNNKISKIMIQFDKHTLMWYIKESYRQSNGIIVLSDIVFGNGYLLELRNVVNFVENYSPMYLISYIDNVKNSKSQNLN